MFSSLFGSCCKNKSKDGVRRTSVDEAEEKLEALKQMQVKKRDVIPPAKCLPLTFIPDLIIKEIQNDNLKSIPCQIHSEAVLLIADVCGFTSLTESYCQKGISGIEELASVLNGYMSILSAMLLASDGDILNFAGDAFLVSWELKGDDEERMKVIEKVFSCSMALQTHESLQTKNLDGRLKVKIGIGSGEIVTWVLGSPTDFLTFVVSGHGLGLVHTAGEICKTEDIIVTQEICETLESSKKYTFKSVVVEDGFVKIYDYISTEGPEPYPLRTDYMEQCNDEQILMAKLFSIPSVRNVSRVSELNYLSELTTVTIVFIAMLDIEVEEPRILDKTFDIILKCAKKQGGVLNKILLFDKGCTYLVVFGLPGNKHSNDAARGLLCANEIAEKHAEINVNISIGVTSGMCFCGIVGHAQRQEYTVIGNRVNLAARIMVVYKDQIIALDSTTFLMSRDVLEESSFVQLASRKMKGIVDAGQIYTYKVSKQRNVKPREEKSFQVIETESVQGIGTKKESIGNCLRLLCDLDERSRSFSSKLLPVLIIEGPTGCGRNYYMYYAIDKAAKMGYKTLACCTIPSYSEDPFSTAALLVKHMLGLEQTDSLLQKQQKILNALSGEYYPQLYLLNHLFCVQFPTPKFVNIDKEFRTKETVRLFKAMFQQHSENNFMILSVDDADAMDPWSWDLLRDLCKEESNLLILLSVFQDFREPSISASLLLLKAHTHVKLEAEEYNDFPALLCWFLGVKGVHKNIYRFLREKTGNNVRLLKEVLNSPSLSQYMDLVPFKNLDKKQKKQFYICEFSSQDNDAKVYVCDINAESNLKNMIIPVNINDAVKETLNFLNIQDRLLLKRAALLGEDFDQHVLEAASPGLSCNEVVSSMKTLMSYNIISSVCTSEVILQRSNLADEPSSQLLDCHSNCFCSSVITNCPFKDYGEAHLFMGPYHRLKFRTNEFRLCILSYMTKEQYHKMHMEIVNELETQGLLCVSCRIKKLERIQFEKATQSEHLSSMQMDLSRCSCLLKRPKVFSLIGYIWKHLGDKLLSAYFAKKAAQASNDVGYPIQALNYAFAAEELLPHQSDAFSKEHETKDKRDFNLSVLKASVRKVEAKSSLLLGNTYEAAAFIQRALLILGLDIVHLHGVYSPKQFKEVTERFPLLEAEFLTKIIGVLAQTYILAEKYELALRVLKMEFVSLSYYPIDFLQILNFMMSLYRCKNELKPGKKFRTIEKNTFKICDSRLQKFSTAPTLLEIQCIGSAYITFIEMNLKKGHLSRAENIAQEALEVLRHINNQSALPLVHIYLIEIYLHQDRTVDCFECLDDLESLVDESMPLDTLALYMCALSHVLVLKFTDGPSDVSDQSGIKKCNKFASSLTESGLFSLNTDIAFYVAIMMSFWSIKAGQLWDWCDSKKVSTLCLEEAKTHYKTWRAKSYWDVGAFLLMPRILIAEDRKDDTHSTLLKDLQQMKKKVKTYFPVYNAKYQRLLKDIHTLESRQMLNTF